MAERSTNTFDEALQKVARDVQQMKILPDADLPFVYQLETLIIGKLREPVSNMQQQGMLPQGGPPPPGMGGPPGPPPGGPSFQGGMPSAPMQRGGAMPGAGAPNADELARLLNSGQ